MRIKNSLQVVKDRGSKTAPGIITIRTIPAALVHVVVLVCLCLFASAWVEALFCSCFVMAMLAALAHVLFLVWLCLLAIAWVEASLSFICLSYSVVFDSS